MWLALGYLLGLLEQAASAANPAGAPTEEATTLASAAAALPAPAALGIHGLSNHPGTNHKNSQNPGVYLRWADDASATASALAGLQLGVYRNSYRTWSAYAGKHLAGMRLGEHITASLMGGGVIGYPMAPLLPMLAGSVRVQVAPQFHLNLTAMPKFGLKHVGVYHLSAEITLP